MKWSERKPASGEWLTGYDHHDVEVLFHYYVYDDPDGSIFLYANKDGTFDYDVGDRADRLPESIKTIGEAKQYVEVLYKMGEL